MNLKLSAGPMRLLLRRVLFAALPIGAALMPALAHGQSRLPNYPGYEEYRRLLALGRGGGVTGVSATWTDGGKGIDYTSGGKAFHFDLATNQSTPREAVADNGGDAGFGFGRRGGRGGAPVAGGGGGMGANTGIARRLSSGTKSPDGKLSAVSRDGNLYISDAKGANEVAVTTEGSIKSRIRFGVPTIVYGEELGMAAGMWWSPDSSKIAFYRFDESKVQDYTVLQHQTSLYDETEIDPYPKAGTIGSPLVELFVYDVTTKQTTKVDVRDGKPFADDTVGYYVYRIAWTPGGKDLLFSRMNRKQNTLELCAADPETGKTRVIVHEEWLANWVDWVPDFEYMPDHKRFIWTSERNGFKNYYLYDLDGKLLSTITNHDYEVAGLVKIDEPAGQIYYMARDGDNYLKLQLHRVNIDGTGDIRLTDPALNHSVTIAPDNRHFIDTYQTHDQPPAIRVLDASGHITAELAKSDTTRMDQAGLKRVELFNFKTLDGTAELQGVLHFPPNFDPAKKYPLLVDVYGGPITNGAHETFITPNSFTGLGFLVASFDSRSLAGRGRKFSDPFYHHMGIIEMDDQAAGVKALEERSYVDRDHVGVFGTSYGGTSAATLLMRYPEVFQAACSNSPVTDYRNYNCIYAERNEGLVSENKKGYDAATIMTYVPNLKGQLLLYYGTADNNVHVSNSLQLIAALQKNGKSFELQVGPDLGHTAVNRDRMMEFFIENLVLKKP
jgi:dipeptidyl-peptidase-4